MRWSVWCESNVLHNLRSLLNNSALSYKHAQRNSVQPSRPGGSVRGRRQRPCGGGQQSRCAGVHVLAAAHSRCRLLLHYGGFLHQLTVHSRAAVFCDARLLRPPATSAATAACRRVTDLSWSNDLLSRRRRVHLSTPLYSRSWPHSIYHHSSWWRCWLLLLLLLLLVLIQQAESIESVYLWYHSECALTL